VKEQKQRKEVKNRNRDIREHENQLSERKAHVKNIRSELQRVLDKLSDVKKTAADLEKTGDKVKGEFNGAKHKAERNGDDASKKELEKHRERLRYHKRQVSKNQEQIKGLKEKLSKIYGQLKENDPEGTKADEDSVSDEGSSVGSEAPVNTPQTRHSKKRHKVHDVAKHKKDFREHELSRRAKNRKSKLEERHSKVKKREDEVAKKEKLAKDSQAVAETVQMSQAKLLEEKHQQSVKAKQESQVANEDMEKEDDFFSEFSHHVIPQKKRDTIEWQAEDEIPNTQSGVRRKL